MSELTTLFQNIADAIRSKTGDTAAIQASQFPAKIQGISVGISQDEADARYLQLAGGTMTGSLTLSGSPTSDLQAATKKYVDDKAGNSEETIIDWRNTGVATETLFCTPQQFAGKSTLIIYADFSRSPVGSTTRAQIGGIGPTLNTTVTWAYNANYKTEFPLQIGADRAFIASYNASTLTTKSVFTFKDDGVYLSYGSAIEVTNGAKIKVCLK